MLMKKNMEWAALAVLLLVLFIVSIYVVRPFLDAVILAAFFAYVTYPIAQRIERILKSKTLSAALVVALAVLPVVVVGLQLVNVYSREFSHLEKIKFSMPMLEEIDWGRVYSLAVAELGSRLSPEKILRGIGMGFEFFIKAFIVLAGSFYMLKERIALKGFLISLAPPSREQSAVRFLDTVDKMFHGIFLGHFITAIATGFIASLGFYLIGAFMGIGFLHTYPLLLGFLTTIATLLPIIGAWLVYIPMSIFLFLVSNIQGALVVLVFGILILSVAPDIFIRPYISGRKGKTHPFVVLLGFICGPFVFGAMGIILGPAILGLFKATLDTYREEILKEQT